jgi:spectinomycin phosphotransferase
MLIKPDFKDEILIRCLEDAYELNVKEIFFLPLGADFNTSVYRVITSSKTDYFLKLRSGEFFDASVSVPKYLAELGFKQVIAPLAV